MKLKNWVLAALVILSCKVINAEESNRQEILKEEGRVAFEKCLRIASQFYTLEEGEDLKEITQTILESPDTKDSIKQKIVTSGRRFFLFKYPSDGYQVKGYISFIPNCCENNLLILLRGGNRIFGLMHPATDFTCIRDYAVITTTYRGGVSEGIDQFGGDEVNDVHNLMLYFPVLVKKLGLRFQPKNVYMLGGSRGGMEMFLSLGRSSFLQQQITKAASLSGLLDIHECMLYREDMRRMFIQDFGLIPEKNEESWVDKRNPINVVPNLRNDLPFLILQGTNDLRVSLNEGYHMLEKLKKNGNYVDYIEVSGGNHCLSNQDNCMELIADWFEK